MFGLRRRFRFGTVRRARSSAEAIESAHRLERELEAEAVMGHAWFVGLHH
jgi:hypothetical protein